MCQYCKSTTGFSSAQDHFETQTGGPVGVRHHPSHCWQGRTVTSEKVRQKCQTFTISLFPPPSADHCHRMPMPFCFLASLNFHVLAVNKQTKHSIQSTLSPTAIMAFSED